MIQTVNLVSSDLYVLFGNIISASDTLWLLMFEYYRPWVSHYAKKLHSNLPSTISRDTGGRSTSDLTEDGVAREAIISLMKLASRCILSLDTDSTSSHDLNLCRLVENAYAMRNMENEIRDALYHGPIKSSHNTDTVWDSIRWMGRLRQMYETFVECATKLSSFGIISIVPVRIPADPVFFSFRNRLTLSKTLECLGRSLNKSTISQYVLASRSLSVCKRFTVAQERFERLQKEHPRVHAEVQLAMFLLQQGYVDQNSNTYLGCSKRNCVLCYEFLMGLGIFSTRGCHWKLYPRWIVPHMSNMPSDTRRGLFCR
jgi:hypothetical protein